MGILSNDWGSPSGAASSPNIRTKLILFSDLPSQFCTCFLLHRNYTCTLVPLLCVFWDPNSHWRALGQTSHHPAHTHWLFQRWSGGKAPYNTKWVVGAKNAGVRGRWQGEVFEREPPDDQVNYHTSFCLYFFCFPSQRLNHRILHWFISDQYLYSHNKANSNLYIYNAYINIYIYTYLIGGEWGKAEHCQRVEASATI